MVRRDAAVDDADDDALAAQLEVGTQAPHGILQAEERGAVVGPQILVRVLPDALDLGALRETRYLPGRQPRRKPVDGVTVAVDLRIRGADAAEQPIVRLLERFSVGVGRRGTRRLRLLARLLARELHRHVLVARGSRLAQLHDVNGRSAFDRP